MKIEKNYESVLTRCNINNCVTVHAQIFLIINLMYQMVYDDLVEQNEIYKKNKK